MAPVRALSPASLLSQGDTDLAEKCAHGHSIGRRQLRAQQFIQLRKTRNMFLKQDDSTTVISCGIG